MLWRGKLHPRTSVFREPSPMHPLCGHMNNYVAVLWPAATGVRAHCLRAYTLSSAGPVSYKRE